MKTIPRLNGVGDFDDLHLIVPIYPGEGQIYYPADILNGELRRLHISDVLALPVLGAASAAIGPAVGVIHHDNLFDLMEPHGSTDLAKRELPVGGFRRSCNILRRASDRYYVAVSKEATLLEVLFYGFSKPEIHAVKDQRGTRMFALHNRLLFAVDYVQD
jgi:hypothetical protein